MSSVEADLQSGDSASSPGEADALPVESIALTIKCLSEVTDQMRLAMTEVLSVTMFCADVKRSVSAMSGPELQRPVCPPAEPVLDQLYQDAHRNLAAMRRVGRQTLAAINGVEQAASTLYRLGLLLDAPHRRAAHSAVSDEPAWFCADRPGFGCAPRQGDKDRTSAPHTSTGGTERTS